MQKNEHHYPSGHTLGCHCLFIIGLFMHRIAYYIVFSRCEVRNHHSR